MQGPGAFGGIGPTLTFLSISKMTQHGGGEEAGSHRQPRGLGKRGL